MEINIPKSWEEVKIFQYYNLLSAIQDKGYKELDRYCAMIAAVTDFTFEQVLNFEVPDFKKAIAEVLALTELKFDERIPHTFKCNGIIYEFDYKNPVKTAGNFIDISELVKNKEETIYNTHKIMAVLCKPYDKTLQQTYQERCEEFYNHLDIGTIYPITLFFSNVLKGLYPHILNSLEKKIENQTKEAMEMLQEEMSKQHSAGTGDGSHGLTSSTKKRGRNGVKLKNGARSGS